MGTPTEQEATLTAPTQVPILEDGKQVGPATLPVGAKVSILKENGDNVLIQAAMGEAWVEANKVERKATPLPITNQVSVQKDTPTEKAEDKPIPPRAKQKKALIVLESATYSPLFGMFMLELKAREWEITIIAPNKTNIYPREGFSGKKIEGDILEADLVFKELNNPSPEKKKECIAMFTGYDAVFVPKMYTYMWVPLKELIKGEITTTVVLGEVIKKSNMYRFLKTGAQEKAGREKLHHGIKWATSLGTSSTQANGTAARADRKKRRRSRKP